MIKKRGLIYYTSDDVEINLFKTKAADVLFHEKFDHGSIPKVFKWEFNSKESRLPNFLGNVELLSIPQSVIELAMLIDKATGIMSSPVTSPEQAEKQERLIEDYENFLYDKESFYYKNRSAIYSEPSYIWYTKNEKIQGVFTGSPSELAKGVLSGYGKYTCCSCGETELTDDIPDMYYDNNQNVYCKDCSNGKSLRHVGQ